MEPECPHKKIVLVYASGEKNSNGGVEKNFLVRCADCDNEFLKMPMGGKEVINLLP